jgi:mRNA interferase RelE/StbE
VAALWTVRLSATANRSYEDFDNSVASQVDAALEKLKVSPELRGYALRGSLAGFRSLVVGKKKLRIIYRIIDSQVLVYVISIGFRRNDEVYIKAAASVDDPPEG